MHINGTRFSYHNYKRSKEYDTPPANRRGIISMEIKEFGRRLRKYRGKIPQEKLGELLGCGQTYISSLEKRISVLDMELDSLSSFFRDRVKYEIEDAKDSTLKRVQEDIEELCLFLKKYRRDAT